MNCDQAFDALTSHGAAQNEALARHLETCPRCCDMADVFSPALELFAPVFLEGEPLGETASLSETVPQLRPSSDWTDTAPWQKNVRSARRVRRDGVKIVGAVALVALLTVAFSRIGRDDSNSGFVNSLAAAECLRESTEPMKSSQAVPACVSCHLQLTAIHVSQPAQVKAEGVIRSCVDCHLAETTNHAQLRVAAAEDSCLFRSTGG